jgi:transcriptional regulator with XRE-family HTH domain
MTKSKGNVSGGALMGAFGQWIKSERQARELTLKGLEAITGVSYGAISDWERGRRTPHRDTAVQVAQAIGADPSKALDALMADTDGYTAPILNSEDTALLARIQDLNPEDREHIRGLVERLARRSAPEHWSGSR